MQPQAVESKWKKVTKNPYVWGFFIGILSLHFVREMSLWRRSAPPPLVQVGEWQLKNHNDQPFGSKDLRGKVVIASFFFTSCPTICPKLTQAMVEVKQRFKGFEDKAHFVSFSVDPETDTPEVLRQYTEKYHIHDVNWTFLTGSKAKMVGVITGQMKLHVGDRESAGDLYNIAHLAEFVLLDQNGDLRGKFPVETPVDKAALERAAKLLIEKGPRA